jgi:hypothetical protein
MTQTNFFESEAFPRFYTAVSKVVLPVLFITCAVALYIMEVDAPVKHRLSGGGYFNSKWITAILEVHAG